MNRERGKNGQFMRAKDTIEDVFALISKIYQLLPVFVGIFLILNYFGGWKALNKWLNLIFNLGNPNCRLICEAYRENDGL